jgi:hypothetical protein
MATLQDLGMRKRMPTVDEFEKIQSCLTQEEMAAIMAVQLKETVPTAIGLRTFVVERSMSVRRQLEGEQPSAGDGSGNGIGDIPFGMPGGTDGGPEGIPPGE